MILLGVFMDIGFGDRRFDRRTWCLHVDRGRNVRVFCPEADLWEKQKIAAIIGANGEYTAAVSYTRGLDEIDPDRIVFWNTVEALIPDGFINEACDRILICMYKYKPLKCLDRLDCLKNYKSERNWKSWNQP